MYTLVVLLACAEGPPAAAVDPVSAEARQDRGARVYAEQCATCHGPTGKGDGPAAAGLDPRPTDLSRPRDPEQRRPPSRWEIVAEGKPGTAMVGYANTLSPEDLAAVQAHVRVLAHGP